MNIGSLISQISGHITVFNATIVALLIISEVLGSVDSIKSSAIYGVFKALVSTLKDQVLPKNQAANTTDVVKTTSA